MITLYHGNDHKLVKPLYGFGKTDNDYGRGFYTTKDYDKAMAWACATGFETAYVNTYELDDTSLNILNLDDYGILSWISEIVHNRGARGLDSIKLAEKLSSKYKIDTSSADVIVGYRADNSYSDIIDEFLLNRLNIDEVERLFKKGELGLQYFIKSEKAFNSLKYVGCKNIDAANFINTDEAKARTEVAKFIRQRNIQIYLNGFMPYGITAIEAVNNNYKYNKEYNYYEPCNEIELNDISQEDFENENR